MSRKPKSRLPIEWQVYTNANRKPIRTCAVPIWKYAVWAIVLLILSALAFFPRSILPLL